MGCCEGKYIISEETDNEIENSIRNSIISLEVNNQSVSDFQDNYKTIIGVPIHEVKDYKWYSHDKLLTLINSCIINTNVDAQLIRQQKAYIIKIVM